MLGFQIILIGYVNVSKSDGSSNLSNHTKCFGKKGKERAYYKVNLPGIIANEGKIAVFNFILSK